MEPRVALPEFRRRDSEGVFECIIEATGRAKSTFHGDIQDFQVGSQEQALGVKQPLLKNRFHDRESTGFAEKIHGVVGMQTAL